MGARWGQKDEEVVHVDPHVGAFLDENAAAEDARQGCRRVRRNGLFVCPKLIERHEFGAEDLDERKPRLPAIEQLNPYTRT